MEVFLYTQDQWAEIPWPQNEQAQFTKRYVEPLLKKGCRAYIENVETELNVLVCGDVVLPYTIGSKGEQNSYVCAPYSQYIEYAKDELRLLGRVTQLACRFLLFPLDWLARFSKINRVEIV